MSDLSFNVKILADRKIDIRQRKFAGTQGDYKSCTITFDVSEIYNPSSSNVKFQIEWFGCADTYALTIPLEVGDDKTVSADVPQEILDVGGTATVYLNEVKVENDKVQQIICSYPLRLYLGNKATGNNSVAVGEYNRNVTDMYLAVVNAKEHIDGQIGRVEDAVDGVEKYDDRIKNNSNSITNLNMSLSGYSKQIDEISENLVNHNVDTSSHNDIRVIIQGLTDRINTLHDCDDITLDQTKEIVAYIKENRSILEGVTTSKVNVSDIIDNLITNVSNKPLSAAQGVELKRLIDAVKIPAKLSELSNDAGFVDDDYVSDAVESVNLPRDIRVKNYDSNSVTVAFETGGGNTNECVYAVDLTDDGKYEVFLYKFVDDGEYRYTLAQEGDEPDGCEGRVYAFTYKVTKGELHYIAVGSAVILNKLVLIESITADGTDGTYTFYNLNLDYLLLDITSLKGAPSNQPYRVYINGDSGKIVAYFSNLVHTSNDNQAFVRIDLKNIHVLKGLAADASNIPAQESKKTHDFLENISAITSVTIAPYNKDVLIQSGSTITLKGREVQ